MTESFNAYAIQCTSPDGREFLLRSPLAGTVATFWHKADAKRYYQPAESTLKHRVVKVKVTIEVQS